MSGEVPGVREALELLKQKAREEGGDAGAAQFEKHKQRVAAAMEEQRLKRGR